MMAKAIWNGATLAESDDIALVEGNPYFPSESVNWDLFRESADTKPTYCHWKGMATYYDIAVGGEVNEGACWRYGEPYEESAVIADRVAFWKGVELIDAPDGTGLVERQPSLRGDKTGWEALCWLIRNSTETAHSAADITRNTDISESDIAEAWAVYDVQRYAGRYKWRLAGGGSTGEPVRIEKTE
jgi:uncharacterized protein (DUF427 family)